MTQHLCRGHATWGWAKGHTLPYHIKKVGHFRIFHVDASTSTCPVLSFLIHIVRILISLLNSSLVYQVCVQCQLLGKRLFFWRDVTHLSIPPRKGAHYSPKQWMNLVNNEFLFGLLTGIIDEGLLTRSRGDWKVAPSPESPPQCG